MPGVKHFTLCPLLVNKTKKEISFSVSIVFRGQWCRMHASLSCTHTQAHGTLNDLMIRGILFLYQQVDESLMEFPGTCKRQTAGFLLVCVVDIQDLNLLQTDLLC